MRRLAMTTVLTALVWVVGAGDGFAEPPANTASEEELPLDLDAGAAAPAAPESPGSYLLRALLSLAIVIVIIYLAYYGLRVFRRGRILGPTSSGHIEVLDVARLDGDKMLYVVAIGKRVLVIGGAGNQLDLLCELDEADAAGLRTGEDGAAASPEQERDPGSEPAD